MTRAVSIVIVNFRTAELAARCLSSIADHRDDTIDLRVVVVDNASGDRSVEDLTESVMRRGWQDWVHVLELERNGGFAFGNNAGIRYALRFHSAVDYVMLLNPDTIVRSHSIVALSNFLDLHPAAGIAGSSLEGVTGDIQASAHNKPSPLGELESAAQLQALSHIFDRYVVTPPVREVAHQCDWVSGAALMLRREVIENLGPLDEGFFLYFEETDYCIRAKEAGWQVWFVPESRVVHAEGSATKIGDLRRRRPPYWFASRRRYFVKHFGIFGLICADLLWLCGRLSLGLRTALGLASGAKREDPSRFAFDLLYGDLASLLSGRLWNDRARVSSWN